MTLQEISELELSNVLVDVLNRILDLSGMPEGEPLYMIDEDNTKSFYERILLHDSLIKPTEARMIEELDEIKSELTVIENARLAEIARVEDIKSRWNVMVDIRGAISKMDIDIPNPALELKRIIEENDQARLALFEMKWAEFVNELEATENRNSRIRLGLMVRNICDEILDIIAGFNVQNGFTKEQKDQMESDYADIVQALSIKRPMKAKPLIEAINVELSIFTQEIKDQILEVYTRNGL